MNGASLGRVRGIDIRVSWSVGIIGWLIAWSLATEGLPTMAEGYSDTAYWIAAVVATVGFLAGLLAHELGHSLVAQSRDVQVSSITLWLFGGIAQLEKQPDSADVAMRIAIAGPAVSAVCGVVGVAAGLVTDGLLSAALIWFGTINLMLAIFNLMPAFPLDGGRVYQAWLWRHGMSHEKATAKAARLGTRLGQILVWIGVAQVLLLGALLGGLWLMAIGWFVREASVVESETVRTDSLLRRFTAADVMSSDPECVSESETVEQFVTDTVLAGRHAAYPVCDADGRVIGLIEVKAVRATPATARLSRTIGELMQPLDEIPTAGPNDTVGGLLRSMQERTATRALVFDDDRLVGIVSPSDIARLTMALELAEGTDGNPPSPLPIGAPQGNGAG